MLLANSTHPLKFEYEWCLAPTLCSQSRFNDLLKPIEICRELVLLIELFTARLPIPVDPCGFWVLCQLQN
jgi:hypothetical protein